MPSLGLRPNFNPSLIQIVDISRFGTHAAALAPYYFWISGALNDVFVAGLPSLINTSLSTFSLAQHNVFILITGVFENLFPKVV